MTGWSRGYLMRRYGVTARPGTAVGAVARETAICSGQLLRSHTLAGARGRIAGWRAAKSLPARQLPAGATTPLGLRQALSLRASGHGA
jgi:hypothetical protein